MQYVSDDIRETIPASFAVCKTTFNIHSIFQRGSQNIKL